MQPHPIHRRHFLSRLTLGASAPLLGPLLEQIAGAAEGKLPPLRFLFVVEGNSLPPLQIHPEGIPFVERENRNKFSDTPLASLKLPVSLQPVEAYRDRLTIVANDQYGLSHGIYHYLERLGARWLLPGERWTIAPRRDNISLEISQLVRPDFKVRSFAGTGGWFSWR